MRPAVNAVLPGGATHVPTLGGALYALQKHASVLRVAGVSAGALMAIAFAFGIPESRILHILQDLLADEKILDKSVLAAKRFGRCSWRRIPDAVVDMLGKGTTLGESPIPLTIVVTDAWTSRPVYLSSLTTPKVLVEEAAGATSAILPVASMQYLPSYLPKRLYFDGGFTDNFPDQVWDREPEPTVSFSLVGKDVDNDGQDDVRPVREWDFDDAAMAVANALTFAASASKSSRDDRVHVPLKTIGSGFDFSLTPAETKARWDAGAAPVHARFAKR
jgi:predicted acylesterase/phospholipase RssA